MGNTEPVRFSLLGAGDPVDDERLDVLLDVLYAYPAGLTRPVVRGNVIASLDGGAVTDGTSGGLGGPGDRRLFGLLRELADVIVVGAGTARAETYAGAKMAAEQRNRRQARGQSEVPPIALVTRSGDLEPDLPVLTDTEVPPLVLTCTAAAAGARTRLGRVAEVIDCSRADPAAVDLGTALAHLGERGLLRVLAEGGPSLLGALIADDLLDELCLTAAPMLVGGSGPRVAAGGAAVLSRMRRAHVITDPDDYLYLRYTRGA